MVKQDEGTILKSGMWGAEETIFEDPWKSRLVLRRHLIESDLMVLYTKNPIEVTVKDLEYVTKRLRELVKILTPPKVV